MNPATPSALRLHLALFLVSAALLGFQLAQMQLLALLQWHHFAYLVISVALLGFGTAGSALALFRKHLLCRLDLLLPLLLQASAVLMALALPLLQQTIRAFDPGLLSAIPVQSALLLLGQTAFLLIFFLVSLPLGLVFVQHRTCLGSLYCANLIGSGAGALGAVALMYFVLPQRLPALAALLCWLAGLLSVPGRRPALLLSAAASLPLILTLALHPPELRPSPYKAVSRALDLPGAMVVRSRPDPQGLIQVVTAPSLRHAPGLSLTFRGTVPLARAALFSNGDWFGAVRTDDGPLLDSSLLALPFAITPSPARVLVLDAGDGTEVRHALRRGAATVTAVEQQGQALAEALARTDIPGGSNDAGSRIRSQTVAPRTWLGLDRDRYDLISLPPVNTFGGNAGLTAMQEQYLLTKESFVAIWEHLSEDGLLRVSAWLDSPPRSSLRLAATLIETLAAAGVDPGDHLAAVRGWDMLTFVAKRSPFTPTEITQVRSFCARLQFDPLLLPGLRPEERQHHHFSPPGFLDNLDRLLAEPSRRELYRQYDFALQPVIDNRPFFSQFLRWRSLPRLRQLVGERALPFLELGYVLVLLGFAQMTVAALVLIPLPLLRLGAPERGGKTVRLVSYFGGLGLGYMFYEMAMIHHLVLYFGHPVIAAAAVIGNLLLFSGLGSLHSARRPARANSHARAAALAAGLILLTSWTAGPLLQRTIALPLIWKCLLFLALTGPPAFVMGMPFPLGLARLAGESEGTAAWAWGINGCVSVVSAGLAAIIAVEAGFASVLLGAGAYGLAALSGRGGPAPPGAAGSGSVSGNDGPPSAAGFPG